MRELIHVELFAGAGGFATGLRPCGFRTAVAVEMWRPAAASFRLNHPGVPLIERDIRSVTGGEVAARLPAEGVRPREADLVTAGVPCQTISRAGRHTHDTFDHRDTLFREVVRIARMVRARVVCFENVKDILDKKVAPDDPLTVAEAIKADLAGAGYVNQIEGVLLAADFGVPQIRRRWFLLAARDPGLRLRLPRPTGPLVTVSEAFAGLPADLDRDGYTVRTSPYDVLMRDDGWWRTPRRTDRLTQHETHDHRPGIAARYAMLRAGRRVANLFDELDPLTLARLQAMGVMPNKAFNLSGDKLHPGRPGLTVTGHACDRMVHPRRNRAITVREAARLQSFPDGCEFAGSLKDRYQQVGNAVPCLLAFHLGLAVRVALAGDAGELRVPHLADSQGGVLEGGRCRG